MADLLADKAAAELLIKMVAREVGTTGRPDGAAAVSPGAAAGPGGSHGAADAFATSCW